MEQTSSDVKFWSCYRFFLDPRYLTLHLTAEQPTERHEVIVPHAQWEAVKRSFERAEAAAWKKENEYDVPTEVRQKQIEADRLLNPPLGDFLRVRPAGQIKGNALQKKFDLAKKRQREAYREIVLWRAKHRKDPQTGETDMWLREPEVRKGICLACEANDQGLFVSLGRILSQKPIEAKRLPISSVIMKNWIHGDPPLAIFSEQALGDFCTEISRQFGSRETFDKDRIRHRLKDYGLQGVSATLVNEGDRRLSEGVGPIIRRVTGTGRKWLVNISKKEISVFELLATRDRISMPKLRSREKSLYSGTSTRGKRRP